MKNVLTVLILLLFGIDTLFADKPYGDVHIGIARGENSYESINDKGEVYILGVGLTKVFDTGLYLGGSTDIEYIDIHTKQTRGENNWGLTLDLRAGYQINYLSFYAIGGLKAIGDDEDYVGFGYGAGVEWRLCDTYLLSAEYKVYDLSGSRIDYDYTTVGMNIKYLF